VTQAAPNIRPTVADDYEEIVTLLDTLALEEHARDPVHFVGHSSRMAADGFIEMLGKEHELHLSAQFNDDVVGYVGAWLFQPGATGGFSVMKPRRAVHVQVIVVRPAHRRTGLGRAMFERVEQWGRECNVESIGFNVSHGNVGARSFYEAQGYGVSTIYMTKSFPPSVNSET
jgi:GNAT superfamily N-acetyltransferase